MGLVIEKNYNNGMKKQQNEVRNLVMAGLEQIKEGKTKEFNEVCERLVKKYVNEI